MKKQAKTFLWILVTLVASGFVVSYSEPIKNGESHIVNGSFVMQMLGIVVAVVFVVGPIIMSRLDEIAETIPKGASKEVCSKISASLLLAKQEIKEDTYALYATFIVAFATCLFLEINIPFVSLPLPELKQFICSTIMLSCVFTALLTAFDLIRALFRILTPKGRIEQKE